MSDTKPLSFRFRNIGPVKDAELELGDLTIIAGRNNTGKTYIVYTLYGFLKLWSGFPLRMATLGPGPRKELGLPNWSQIGKKLTDRGRVTFPLNNDALNQQRKALMPVLAHGFSESALPEIFSSQHSAFESASIEITCDGQICNPPRSMQAKVSRNFSFSFEYDCQEVVITRDRVPRRARHDSIHIELAHSYSYFLLESLFPDPFILSAERFGISLFYRELDFTKNQVVDLLQKMGENKSRDAVSPYLIIDRATSRYALPIKDNIDYTRSIPERRGEKSEFYGSKLFDSIKDMMDGYYRASGDDLRFKSKARSKGRNFDIPLYLASSSARGLSDLYFFLRHAARSGQLLIIDEPESHLDTANQILLARLLARFVRAGLKVLITTHSDYIIKEVNNLIMLSRPFQDKSEIVKGLGYNSDDHISPQHIRAYVAKNGGLTPCTVDPLGIEMPVFDETIEKINRVANRLAAYASIGSPRQGSVT